MINWVMALASKLPIITSIIIKSEFFIPSPPAPLHEGLLICLTNNHFVFVAKRNVGLKK